MAIVIEQEQGGRGTGILKIAVWIAIIIAILLGAYYLFFRHPDVIPSLAQPSGLKDVNVIAGVKLDPAPIVQGPTFQSLRQQAPDMPQPQTGRPNPFAP